MLDLDPVLLARIQFAFTVSFHIVFPAFTIGLASWLAVVEGLWRISFIICMASGLVFYFGCIFIPSSLRKTSILSHRF